MSIFSNLYNRLLGWRRPRPPPGMEERLSWLLRPYLHTLEDILTWKNSTTSLAFFIGANIVLWLFRLYEVRILGVLGGSLLLAAILDALASHLAERRARVSPRARREMLVAFSEAGGSAPQLRDAVRSMGRCATSLAGQLAHMRDNNHGQFCGLVCSGITALWLVVWFGGGLFWHGLLSALLLSPLIPALKDSIRHHSDSDGEVEGFLPELSPMTLKELHAAGEQRPEPQEFSSLMSDLSLPNDDDVLRYATGEVSSSEDEMDGRDPPTPDPPQQDSTDSDSEFLIHEKDKKSKDSKHQTVTSWFSASSILPSAPPQQSVESDSSDEFEIVDKDDL